MKYIIHLVILFTISNYTQAQNPIKTDGMTRNYFTKVDFDKIIYPFSKSKCEPKNLIKQTKELNAKYEYRYLYQDDSEPNLSLNLLSKEEMCILLKSNYVTGLYNDEYKLEKPIFLWQEQDFLRYNLNKIEVNLYSNDKKCVNEGGVPFIVRFEKKNNSITRNIFMNENANLKCFTK